MTLTAALLASAVPVQAAPLASNPGSSDEPVLLTADQVDYDQPNAVVSATGHVEIVQGETIILADRLVYRQEQNLVEAQGNVSMLEPSGNVYFADALELQDDLKAGIITHFRARLTDDSLFAANGARRLDEDRIELFRAVYSPCKCLTDEGEPKNPLWQIRADHVLIDDTQQQVSYRNAYMDYYGFPILYTPYFSHPTPDADNQSGILMPEFLHTSNLGNAYKLPLYYSIAADKDLTLTPIYTSNEGLVMTGEYRQKLDSGAMHLDGSITSARKRDIVGNRVPGHETRGHLNAVGAFVITPQFDWGFDIHRASDDSYLRRYNFSNETLLTSRVYGQGFNFVGDSDRNYAIVQGLAFQGLTGQYQSDRVPIVAPLADFTWQSRPGLYQSRFRFDANGMVLYRHDGSDSRRLSMTPGFTLPYITDNGQVIEFNARLRTDIYDVNDVMLPNGQLYDGITGRMMPEASVQWSYPVINRWNTSSLLLEPIVHFAISPGGGNPSKIPNEDSLLPEFNDTNLFDTNRYPGLDRIENGTRVSYGLRGQVQLFSTKYIDWLLGQHYRFSDSPNFPFSRDPTEPFSDYVGKIGLTYDPFTIAYRFRLDRETLAATRSEVEARMHYYPVSLSLSYLSLKDDPVLADKEVIIGGTSITLTDNWSWSVTGIHDLRLNQTNTINTGLNFKNECVNAMTMVGKDYTNLLDVKPSTTFWFRLSLKNLE